MEKYMSLDSVGEKVRKCSSQIETGGGVRSNQAINVSLYEIKSCGVVPSFRIKKYGTRNSLGLQFKA